MNTIKAALLAEKNVTQAIRKYHEAVKVVEEKRPDLHARLANLVEKRKNTNINWIIFVANESCIKTIAEIYKRQ